MRGNDEINAKWIQALSQIDIPLSLAPVARLELIGKVVDAMVSRHPCGLGVCPYTNTRRADCGIRFVRSTHNVIHNYLEVELECSETTHSIIYEEVEICTQFLQLVERYHQAFPTKDSLLIMNRELIKETLEENADKLQQ